MIENSTEIPLQISPPYTHNINKNDSSPTSSESTWKLISQGAEARIWYIPSFITSSTNTNAGETNNEENRMDSPNHNSTSSLSAICKERFPKKYRHAKLDANILKSRTKSEVKCLIRCRRGGVPCPAILACDMGPKIRMVVGNNNDNDNCEKVEHAKVSMCLFMEFIPGITVREFLDQNADSSSPSSASSSSNQCKKNSEISVLEEKEEEEESPSSENGDPPQKKSRSEVNSNENEKSKKKDDSNDSSNDSQQIKNNILKKAAYAIGTVVAKMHNVNVVHGDLTTSNIILKNPETWKSSLSTTSSSSSSSMWEPNLVLIDFGLAGTAGAKGVNHEEKAVDLYVLERALDSTHPSCSQLLQKEIFRAYKKHCLSSDSVLQRLSQVRLRGRKRECFG